MTIAWKPSAKQLALIRHVISHSSKRNIYGNAVAWTDVCYDYVMNYKVAFGFVSIVLAVVGYIPYIRDILRQKTKPHSLTWLVWSVLSGIGFAVQVVGKGGAGSWLFGLTTVASFGIFLLSLKIGDKNILLVDWLSLLLAAAALGWWLATNDPLLSVILISAVDVIGGFFPTFRKSYSHPYQETLSTYLLYALSLCFSLAALDKFTLTNALYPATFVVVNIAMVSFLLLRRSQTAV